MTYMMWGLYLYYWCTKNLFVHKQTGLLDLLETRRMGRCPHQRPVESIQGIWAFLIDQPT